MERNKRKSPTKRHELSFIDNIIDNKRKKESGIDSSSSEKCVPENPTLEMTSSVDKSETTEQLADAPGKSNAENKENISSSDLNNPSCNGVNINKANNILKQNSISGLTVEIQTLREENERLRDQVRDFQAQDKAQDVVQHVLSTDKLCNHYTGLSLDMLYAIFNFLEPGCNGENICLHNYRDGKGNDENRGRKRSLKPLDSYLLTLIGLHRNVDLQHLTYLFCSSEGTVSNTIITWINFMYIKFGSVSIWPSREKVQETMPLSMKTKFPNVRCIIDCVEFKVAVPSSLCLHKMMYSEYKSHTTVKALVGIAPGGGVTSISQVFPGSISDKQIVIKSGILNSVLWEKGDAIMADRGFTVEDFSRPVESA